MAVFRSSIAHARLLHRSHGRRGAPAVASARASLHAAALACSLALWGCDVRSTDEPPVASWEEFKASVTRHIDGRQIYVVEWDLAVSEEELRARYDDYVVRARRESEGLGEQEQPSLVNRVGTADDIWAEDSQYRLTYCVSNAFGANKARAVSEMAQATAAWQAVARVSFTYLPQYDASCTNANANVTFSVIPGSDGGGCAFFPSGGGCVPRSLTMDLPALDANYHGAAPNMTTVGVFRHELGHILGLRHEHTHPASGTCFENNAWRALSPYDRGSVMHYPWCNGLLESDLSITPYDALGVALLYGGSVENLAVGRSASQSSTEHDGAASHAVDGNTDGDFFHRSVTHTSTEAQPWWQVDLGAITELGEVVLYNRTECCGDRLADFDIQLSNDGVAWQNVAGFAGPAPARVALPITGAGRFVRVRLRGFGILNLAEVQVRPRNLALGKPASQSSTEHDGAEWHAVDGNTDGDFFHGSVTHTSTETQPWWQVDLGAVTDIGHVVLYNRTECCSDRLTDVDLQISNDAATWQTVASVAGQAPTRTPLLVRAQGRYVRVRLRGFGILSLAEVEVFGMQNLALGKPATQSTTFSGGVAARAVDGNTDGVWTHNSVTHTIGVVDLQPWWQVDLGAVRGISHMVLYNRTDCCAERLANFDIQLSNDGSTWQTVATVTGQAPTRSVYPIRASSQYVRVRMRGLAGILSLAEVQVFAP